MPALPISICKHREVLRLFLGSGVLRPNLICAGLSLEINPCNVMLTVTSSVPKPLVLGSGFRYGQPRWS